MSYSQINFSLTLINKHRVASASRSKMGIEKGMI